jgi:hypothetical protein
MDGHFSNSSSWPGIAVRMTASLTLAYAGHPRLSKVYMLAEHGWINRTDFQSGNLQTALLERRGWPGAPTSLRSLRKAGYYAGP